MFVPPPHTLRTTTERAGVLVVAPQDDFRQTLCDELRALPLAVASAEDLGLAVASATSARIRPRVVLIAEHAIETEDLERTLAELRVRTGAPHIVPIVFGRGPDVARRAALRSAGVELALFGRFGRHALRFQVNRALAPQALRGERGEPRAPMEWRTRVFAEGREKSVRCYSLSSAGGYFVTPRPWVVGSQVELELPSSAPARFVIEGRIVYTHASGHEAEKGLPRGMAVAFSSVDADLAHMIRRGVAASRSALFV